VTEKSERKVFRMEEAELYSTLRPTVIEAQLYYIDWRDGSIPSQLVIKLSHSPAFCSALHLRWVIS